MPGFCPYSVVASGFAAAREEEVPRRKPVVPRSSRPVLQIVGGTTHNPIDGRGGA